MSNQEMPNSDYNITRLGYAMLWERVVQFHQDLKTEAENRANQDYVSLLPHHVDEALNEINEKIYWRIQREKQVQIHPIRRFFNLIGNNAGSAFFGAFIGKVVETGFSAQGFTAIQPGFWFAGIIGAALFIYQSASKAA